MKSADEVEQLTGISVLGSIPYVPGRDRNELDSNLSFSAFEDVEGPLSEAARSLRTSLLFSSYEGAPKVLHFTSPAPGEGKSVSVVATAAAFAQSGGTVLCMVISSMP